ncbi:hypothetical protein ACQJBY_002090 [Aegilops geniculata]
MLQTIDLLFFQHNCAHKLTDLCFENLIGRNMGIYTAAIVFSISLAQCCEPSISCSFSITARSLIFVSRTSLAETWESTLLQWCSPFLSYSVANHRSLVLSAELYAQAH